MEKSSNNPAVFNKFDVVDDIEEWRNRNTTSHNVQYTLIGSRWTNLHNVYRFTDYEENRDSFSETLDLLLEGGARVGIATHDPILVERALASLKRFGVGKDRYEFQMLLGVTERLRARLVADPNPSQVAPDARTRFAQPERRAADPPTLSSLQSRHPGCVQEACCLRVNP